MLNAVDTGQPFHKVDVGDEYSSHLGMDTHVK